MLAGPYSDELFAFACKRASSRGRVERQNIRFDVDSSPRSVSWNKGREEKRKKEGARNGTLYRCTVFGD
jgi:hypothetical protein